MSTNTPIILNQIMVRKWAYYGSSYLGNDSFYLLEFIELALQDMGEPNVVKMLISDKGRNKERLNKIGNEWNLFRRKLNRLKLNIAKAKAYYDRVEKKDFSKIESSDVQGYLRYIKRLSLIEADVYALAIFLLNNSKIRGQTIQSQDWNVLEHTGLKKLEVTRRKPLLENSEGKFDGSN